MEFMYRVLTCQVRVTIGDFRGCTNGGVYVPCIYSYMMPGESYRR